MNEIEIIGINNFIGFHLAKHFLEQGMEVIGYTLPLENDDFQLKKLELGRNANLTIKELNEATLKKKVIIDLYGVNNPIAFYELMKDQLTEVDYIILSNEFNKLEYISNIICLPLIIGPWDYVEDEKIIKENSSVIGITDVCSFLEKKLTEDIKITIEECYQSANLESDFLNRQNWINRYKKSK